MATEAVAGLAAPGAGLVVVGVTGAGAGSVLRLDDGFVAGDGATGGGVTTGDGDGFEGSSGAGTGATAGLPVFADGLPP